MLRIMTTDMPFAESWVLQGGLCGQCAVDLEEKLDEARNAWNGEGASLSLTM